MCSEKNYGLMKHGFITNLPGQLNSFNKLLSKSGKVYSQSELDQLVDAVTPAYWDAEGADITTQTMGDQYRVYKVLYTGCTTASGEEVLGLLKYSPKYSTYSGVTWGTYEFFQRTIRLNNAYVWLGKIAFDSQSHLNSFLKGLADMAYPEPWDTDPDSSTGGFDFLKSHVGFTLARLREEQMQGKEGKILYSKDRSRILWNTNLCNRVGEDILLCAQVRRKPGGSEFFVKPLPITKGIRQLRALGFDDDDHPKTAVFYENAGDLVFHPEWKVDLRSNYDKVQHAAEERIYRFPTDVQGNPLDCIARCLTNAIRLSVDMSRRDLRFIVPMYSPSHHQIQFIMPLFLDGNIKETPDMAVILTADNGYYIPETVIGMKEAYQDVRLITKPSEDWLK